MRGLRSKSWKAALLLMPLAVPAIVRALDRRRADGAGLLEGDRDRLTNLEVNRRTGGLLPDARMAVFPGAGHCSLLETADEFNRELGLFLDEAFDG